MLLIDVQKYNNMNILSVIDELAMGNGRGEYVVGKLCILIWMYMNVNVYMNIMSVIYELAMGNGRGNTLWVSCVYCGYK